MKKSSKTFILSDETTNMFGWSLSTDGLEIVDFLLNPVMLYNHDYTKLIGQWVDVRKEDGKLLGVPMFDENDTEAMMYYDKVEQGILKAASVGIMPIKFDEVNARMDNASVKESSLTPVGANRNAITVYDTNGNSLSGNAIKGYCLSLHQHMKTPLSYDELAANNPEHLMSIQKNDPQLFQSLLSAKVSSVRQKLTGAFEGCNFQAITNAPVFKAMNLNYDELAENDPARLADIQKNDPSLFERLLSAKVATVKQSGICYSRCL